MVAAIPTMKPQVTQRYGSANLAQLREAAVTAAQAVYRLQPVKQADGTTLPLCWNGRMHRAFALAEQLQAAGDKGRLANVEQAIAQIGEQKSQVEAAAAAAESDYLAVCAAAGVQPEPLPEYVCSCLGCVAQRRTHALSVAQGDVRAYVWALLGAPVNERPALLTLVRNAQDVKARDQLWAHLARIADAFEAYETACADLGEQPKWREVWR